jgi:hypothetical protein
MSKEEEVMLFEVMQDMTLAEVTPEPGKGALGTWRSQDQSQTQGCGKLIFEAATSLIANRDVKGCMRASA